MIDRNEKEKENPIMIYEQMHVSQNNGSTSCYTFLELNVYFRIY